MHYSNEVIIAFKDNETAIEALKILRNRLVGGFECDSSYKRNPSMMMHDNLDVEKNYVFLFDNIGCYTPEDAEDVVCELLQHLAKNISDENFSCGIWNNSDYTDGSIKAKYENDILNIKTKYYPSGYCALYCPECGEVIAEIEEYEDGTFGIDGTVCICTECGEEIDLSEWLPIESEKTVKII